jgi:hypothetical protein
MLALLYVHAYRRRGPLGLNRLETFETRSSIGRNLFAAGVGAVSIALALTLPERLIGLAGYVYFLFGPVFWAHGAVAGARRRKILAASLPARP